MEYVHLSQFHLKICENKVKNVCANVPSTSCKLIGYAECDLVQQESAFNETEVVMDGVYVPWECNNVTKKGSNARPGPCLS